MFFFSIYTFDTTTGSSNKQYLSCQNEVLNKMFVLTVSGCKMFSLVYTYVKSSNKIFLSYVLILNTFKVKPKSKII
jgi:hypothetical protein